MALSFGLRNMLLIKSPRLQPPVVTDTPFATTVPTGITARPLGYSWVCSEAAGGAGEKWYGYDTAGVLQVTSHSSGLNNWQQVCYGPDGRVWGIGLTSAGVPSIAAMDGTGTFTSYSASANVGTQGYDIIADPDGRVWFADYGTNQIGAVTVGGTFTYYKTLTMSSQPWGITTGSDGNIWFTEKGANKLGRVNVTTNAVTEYVGIPASAGLQGITTGSDGDLWFCESGNAGYWNGVSRHS